MPTLFVLTKHFFYVFPVFLGGIARTVDIQKMDNAKLEIKGRHDPCIVQRAVPVVEAVAAIGLLDLMMEAR